MIRFTETIMSLRKKLLGFAQWLSGSLRDIAKWLIAQADKLDEITAEEAFDYGE